MLTLACLFEGKCQIVEENILKNLLLRLFVKPYPAGLVWLVREFTKHSNYDNIIKRVCKNNSSFENILIEIFRFVSENYKNLENYL